MSTKFKIEFIDEDNQLIDDIEAPFNPYKIGDIVNLNISVHTNGFWGSKEDLKGEYMVVGVTHFVSIDYYGGNLPEAKCMSIMTASVKLRKND